jgi:hypothetical protein
MTAHSAPELGSFLRPVGKGFAYCLELVGIYPPSKDEPRMTFEFKRWGMKDGRPFYDGHRDHSWLKGLRQVLPGVWKDEWEFDSPRWCCCPLYYRSIDTGPNGQMQLI